MNEIDVAIIGGGPAGLQAALILARTRKNTVVFDAQAPPRNHASHGVHNFVGLDGMLPQEIRDQAWSQIDKYESARSVREAVTAIRRSDDSDDLIVVTSSADWQAKQVVLTCGYEDRPPDIPGFAECWATTIIPCPFCDGYENRDRVWGIVASSAHEIDAFPAMSQNWTDDRFVVAHPSLEVSTEQRAMLEALDVPLHVGVIVAINHDDGRLTSVTLDSGETIEAGTLLWTPDEVATPLVSELVETLGLEIDDNGYVAVGALQQTNIDRLWAAGDVQGWMGAIEAANAGGMAAAMIVHDWYASAPQGTPA